MSEPREHHSEPQVGENSEHFAEESAPTYEQPATTSAEPGAENQAGEPWFDETWTRVHPLSPLVQGWLVVVGIPVAIFGYNWEFLVSVFNDIRSGDLIRNINENPTPYMIGTGIAGAAIIIIFLMYVLGWWFTRYKITEEHVMVKSGVIFRQHRQARIDRVQAVDLRQPLMARITGLAELKFEVAEGDGTAAALAFLRKAEAEQLRQEIMDRASGRSSARQAPARADAQASEQSGEVAADHSAQPHSAAGTGADQAIGQRIPYGAEQGVGEPGVGEPGVGEQGTGEHGTLESGAAEYAAVQNGGEPNQGIQADGEFGYALSAPDREITRVPVGRLIGSMVAGPGTLVLLVVLGIFGVVIAGIALFGSLASGESIIDSVSEGIGGVSPGTFIVPAAGAFFAYWGQFSRGYRFTAIMTEAGLRLKYGLTETTTQTVPPGRVQAIRISQPVFWRPFGWYMVQVTVAGYGIDQRSTLLPVGRKEDVMAIAAEMFPDLKVENPEEMFIEGLRGKGSEGGFTTVPLRARLFDPIVRRRRGFFATPSALMLRDGRASRSLIMVPHERIQSLSLTQGPFARQRRVATLTVHLPAGPITPRAKNQDVETLQRLFEYESGHAATARRLADRNQWMKPEELREFEKSVVAPAGDGAARV